MITIYMPEGEKLRTIQKIFVPEIFRNQWVQLRRYGLRERGWMNSYKKINLISDT